jgi:hypothetical protein
MIKLLPHKIPITSFNAHNFHYNEPAKWRSLFLIPKPFGVVIDRRLLLQSCQNSIINLSGTLAFDEKTKKNWLLKVFFSGNRRLQN